MANDTRDVYLVRHAEQVRTPGTDIWQVGAPLKEGAEERVKLVAGHFHDNGIHPCTYRHSHLLRSKQTCGILREFMGSKARPALNENLGPGQIEEWNRRYANWKKAQTDPSNPPKLDYRGFNNLWPDLCRAEAERVLQCVSEIANEIPAGQCAVAVGHIPLIRLAQMYSLGTNDGPELNYCDTIMFTFNEGNLVFTQALLF